MAMRLNDRSVRKLIATATRRRQLRGCRANAGDRDAQPLGCPATAH
jgi:hypothetical protein